MIDLRRSALLLVCALAACDGVGRALVETAPEGEVAPLSCEPYACKRLPSPVIPTIPARDTDPKLGECTPRSVERCEPADETAPGFNRPPPGVCQRTLSLDDDEFDPDALRELTCTKVRLTRTQSGPGAVLRVEDVHWSQLDLEIDSAGEVALELVRANLDQLQVRLRGPVALRVIDSPEVSAIALATDSPAASVDFRATSAERVGIGQPQAEWGGTVSSTQSTLRRAQVFARDVRLEIVSLRESVIEASRIQFVDVTSRTLALSFDSALIGTSRLTAVEVKRCGALSLYTTTLSGFIVPSCTDAPTRVVASAFRRGSLDGDILADNADFQRTAFGLREPTELQLWDNSMLNVNFCANTDRIVIGGNSSAECALCREMDGSRVPIDACIDEQSEPAHLKCCLALEEAETCRPDPDRMRPPFN